MRSDTADSHSAASPSNTNPSRAESEEKNVAVKVVDCRKRDDKAIQEQLREAT